MICHVYRRGSVYWGKLQLDHEQRLTRVSLGTTDRRIAQAKLWELAKEREREAAGLLPPRSVREAATRALPELLSLFLADLEAKGRRVGTLAKYRKTLAKVFGRCRWRSLVDVTPRSFCEWRSRSGLSAKTLNDLLGALTTFLRWLKYQGYAADNPLELVQRIDTRGTEEQYRRALSDDELRRLLEVAPPHRRIVYLTAAFTGLRRIELSALRWADIDLGETEPAILLRGGTTKNRRGARIPLHPDLAQALREFRRADAAPFQTPFCGLVPRVPTFRKDLVRAEIPFEDDAGRRVDLHALRHTFGTNLVKSGAQPRVVMELMRHSDIRLTMRIYTDPSQLPLADAVSQLPGLRREISLPVSASVPRQTNEAKKVASAG